MKSQSVSQDLGNNINFQEEIKKCKTQDDLFGENGLIKKLVKIAIENMLQAEMEDHLGRKKYVPTIGEDPNYRNGTRQKEVRTSAGKIEIDIPRDRDGTYEPRIIENYEASLGEFDKKIISMYSKGLGVRDIQSELKDMYQVEVSPTLISSITDKIMPSILEWQNRMLDKIYPIIYMDAIHYKVKTEGRIISRAVYICMGVDVEGYKDILGIWVGENEGAKYWLGICNELKARGVEDIFLACVDGLNGLPDALKVVFPKIDIQTCIVHQIRNSFKYIAAKDKSEFVRDIKTVYRAASEELAFQNLEHVKDKWGKKYGVVIESWYNNWEHLTTYFKYPECIRKIIYTTNTIEGFNRQLRKYTKTKGVFPTEDSLKKSIYLATVNIMKNWTMPILDWGHTIAQFSIMFPDRYWVFDSK